NVRWIAATNRDLQRMVDEGRFREDLYHRISVFPVRLPPLRDRLADIVPLARRLLEHIAGRLGRPDARLEEAAYALLARQVWRGNVRELANVLERAVILADGSFIQAAHLGLAAAQPVRSGQPRTLDEVEREAIHTALAAADGNRRRAAETLGIGLRTLY